MKPGAALAVALISRYLAQDAEPTPARALLRHIGRSAEWMDSEDDLAEAAELWESKFLRLARRELSRLHELGRVAPFAFNSSDPSCLQGAAFIEPADPEDVAAAKRNRARLTTYSSALADLTATEFEVLCRGVLSVLGVEDVYVTPRSADEGLDFYGVTTGERLLAPSSTIGSFSKQVSVWLLGQAKHYSKASVTTSEIRNLVGSVTLAKAQAYGSVSPKYENLRIRVCDPVVCLFFTTGRLTSTSWRIATKSGVAALDGDMIAALLAENEIGVVDGHYSPTAFLSWLNKPAAESGRGPDQELNRA